MIYTCWNCGWRINQRTPGEADNVRIGSHLLHNHHAFCSQYCIDDNSSKSKFKQSRPEPDQDWNTTWKAERRNKKRPKHKKSYKSIKSNEFSISQDA